MDTQITLAPPRVFHLLPSINGPYCMLGLFGQNKQSNDHSPSMTLSKKLPKQMIKSLKENFPKILGTMLIMV